MLRFSDANSETSNTPKGRQQRPTRKSNRSPIQTTGGRTPTNHSNLGYIYVVSRGTNSISTHFCGSVASECNKRMKAVESHIPMALVS